MTRKNTYQVGTKSGKIYRAFGINAKAASDSIKASIPGCEITFIYPERN